MHHNVTLPLQEQLMSNHRSMRPQQTVIPSSIMGMFLLLGTEIMLFAAFISAYLVNRANAAFTWPPPGQPRLPIETTALNSLFLLASAVTLIWAYRMLKQKQSMAKWIGLTIGLGSAFVFFQGLEWLRLIHYGLTVASSLYGAFFYLIIGAHALHAVVGLILLGALLVETQKRPQLYQMPLVFFNAHSIFGVCSIYWFFVVGLWPILYVLVYLL